jgi:hypothetical protein
LELPVPTTDEEFQYGPAGQLLLLAIPLAIVLITNPASNPSSTVADSKPATMDHANTAGQQQPSLSLTVAAPNDGDGDDKAATTITRALLTLVSTII